jgi:hypothetical protein
MSAGGDDHTEETTEYMWLFEKDITAPSTSVPPFTIDVNKIIVKATSAQLEALQTQWLASMNVPKSTPNYIELIKEKCDDFYGKLASREYVMVFCAAMGLPVKTNTTKASLMETLMSHAVLLRPLGADAMQSWYLRAQQVWSGKQDPGLGQQPPIPTTTPSSSSSSTTQTLVPPTMSPSPVSGEATPPLRFSPPRVATNDQPGEANEVLDITHQRQFQSSRARAPQPTMSDLLYEHMDVDRPAMAALPVNVVNNLAHVLQTIISKEQERDNAKPTSETIFMSTYDKHMRQGQRMTDNLQFNEPAQFCNQRLQELKQDTDGFGRRSSASMSTDGQLLFSSGPVKLQRSALASLPLIIEGSRVLVDFTRASTNPMVQAMAPDRERFFNQVFALPYTDHGKAEFVRQFLLKYTKEAAWPTLLMSDSLLQNTYLGPVVQPRNISADDNLYNTSNDRGRDRDRGKDRGRDRERGRDRGDRERDRSSNRRPQQRGNARSRSPSRRPVSEIKRYCNSRTNVSQGDCKYGTSCKFDHACANCGGDHPLSACAKSINMTTISTAIAARRDTTGSSRARGNRR